jgi:hypothetical protein
MRICGTRRYKRMSHGTKPLASVSEEHPATSYKPECSSPFSKSRLWNLFWGPLTAVQVSSPSTMAQAIMSWTRVRAWIGTLALLIERFRAFLLSSQASTGICWNRPRPMLSFRFQINNLFFLYPCYRPWRPLGLREVEASTLLRQTAKRWWQGCQPYAPAALYPPGLLLFFFFYDSWYSFLLEAESTPGP